MRGEYLTAVCASETAWGSPPHARGIPCGRCAGDSGSGITPACAGNTAVQFEQLDLSGDHPRMRGEYKLDGTPLRGEPGSPPHARGIPLHIPYTRLFSGITPACAGNTTPFVSTMTCCTGSPPHARGILFHGQRTDGHSGITPACAGNTYLNNGTRHLRRDHPRMRGEYL